MTKIGENNNPPKRQTTDSYHNDLEKHILKFAHMLEAFTHSYGEEKTRLKASMDDHLQLIQSATSEIKIRDIHKVGEKLAKDYHLYMGSHTSENYAAVEQDLQTLRECNRV